MKPALFILIVLFISCSKPIQPKWEVQQKDLEFSMRGISAVSDDICWVSGHKGAVFKTLDGGKNWQKLYVPEADSLDFRDVQAFSENLAYIMSAGPGAHSRIFKTIDGGETWTQQFVNQFSEGFFNAMSFWDEQNGIALSDPVENTHYLIKTSDGGQTWNRIDPSLIPEMAKNEYGFAASGTNLTLFNDLVFIGTGGSQARVFKSENRGETWSVYETPIQSGKPSAGIFSLEFNSANYGIAVGGDYELKDLADRCAMITMDGGESWELTEDIGSLPYRSCVRFQPNSKNVFAVGRSGSNYSDDYGKTWKPIDDQGFYTMSFSPSGKTAYAAGKGVIGKLRL